MLPVFALSVAGIFLDSRIVTRAALWLKPAKFALSMAIYAGTLAWMFQHITVQRRFVRRLGIITALMGIIEIVIIDLQAARGTTSHFNIAMRWAAGVPTSLDNFARESFGSVTPHRTKTGCKKSGSC